MSATFTPGLPPAGSATTFIGRDAQDRSYLLRWHEANGWEALGWFGAGKAAMPALRHPAGDDQGLIVGHIEIGAALASEPVEAFQQRVQPWMMACFGAEISADVVERNHRFLEEALELVQSTGCTASEAHQLVDYVFGREIGETHQEIGGVMVTLAALCLALGEDVHAAGETELARIWTKVEMIRAKQAAKPKHSPLPQHVEAAEADMRAFGASEIAAYKWPDDTAEHRAARSAFCEGAASIQPTASVEAVLDQIDAELKAAYDSAAYNGSYQACVIVRQKQELVARIRASLNGEGGQ